MLRFIIKENKTEIEESDLLASIDASKMIEEGKKMKGLEERNEEKRDMENEKIVYRDNSKGLEGIVSKEERRGLSLEFSKQPHLEEFADILKKDHEIDNFDNESNWESMIIDGGKFFLDIAKKIYLIQSKLLFYRVA